ncbi:MAG: PH domain-containing protein [Pirellulales bacterium]
MPEVTLWEGRYVPQAMYGEFALAALATLAGFAACVVFGGGMIGWAALAIVAGIVWAALGIVYWYRRTMVHYKLTNLRFFLEVGMLSKKVDHMEVVAMKDFETNQGFIERIFKVGDLKILSSDHTQPELLLRGIPNVRETADVFDKARRAERQRRGVYVETM